MKFIVSSADLASQLNTIKSVVNSKNTLPILNNFLCTLSGNELKIEATDLETRLETRLELQQTEGSGTIAIDAKKLTEILSSFSDEPLTFNIDLTTNKIEINSASGLYNIPGVSGEEFPKVMPLQDTPETPVTSFKVSSEVLQKGLSATVFATADDETRPVLTGVLFELTQEYFRLVATDSHKLARYTRSDVKADKDASFIFPKKPATILKSILAKDNGEVIVEFDSKQVIMKTKSYVLGCRLIDGRYPAYNAVIPTENPNKLTVSKDDFSKKLRRVSLFSNQANNLARLEMSGSKLLISAENLDFQESAKEELSCTYVGEDIKMGFKSKFLVTILDNINSVEVCLELSDPTRAGLIIPAEKEDENEDVLMLLMPMMIN